MVTKTVIHKGEQYESRKLLAYAVGAGDSLIDRQATAHAGGAIRMLICNMKYGCKRHMTVWSGALASGARCARARRAGEETAAPLAR